MTPALIDTWHHIVKSKDAHALEALLDPDAVFESPVVHSPQRGKPIVSKYLQAALVVLNNDSFTYLHEWYAEQSAVLEFQTTVDGIVINGVDMIWWNAQGKIVRFKVMVRPLKAVNKLHELMGQMLQRMA